MDIPAYDSTRVLLDIEDEIHVHDYINASYVPNRRPDELIAAQGPLRHTVYDFWRMVWQTDARVVLMLAETVEGGREKVSRYWPAKCGAVDQWPPFSVELVAEKDDDDVVHRVMHLTSSSSPDEVREVHQLQCRCWQDHGVASEQMVLGLRHTANALNAMCKGEHPIIVHCSAGVGRTGCYLATEQIISRIEDATPNTSNEELAEMMDVTATTLALRKARPRMIQTSTQFELVFCCVLKWLDAQLAAHPSG